MHLPSTSDHSAKHWVPLTILVVVASALIISINYWSVDFPNADDYPDLISPLIDISGASSWLQMLGPLFEPHAQHNQTAIRIAAWLSSVLTGSLSFRGLLFAGSLFIVPLLVLLGRQAQLQSGWAHVLVACLLCQPQFAEATQWATAIPYVWVYVLALASFEYYCRGADSTPRFSISVGLSMVAVLTFGNGLLVPLELFLFAVLMRDLRAWAFLLPLGVGIVLALRNSNVHSTSLHIHIWSDMITYFCRLLGCAIGFLSPTISLVAGCLAFGSWLCFLFRDFFSNVRKAANPLCLFESFILGSCALCSIFRMAGGPVTAYSTGRYTFPSILFLSCLAIRVWDTIPISSRALVPRAILVGACISWLLYSYNSYYSAYELRHDLLHDSMVRWKCLHDGLAGLQPAIHRMTHQSAEDLGIIKPVSGIDCNARFSAPQESSQLFGQRHETIVQVEHYILHHSLVHLSGYAFRSEDHKWDAHYFLILKNASHRYTLQLERRRRPDVSFNIRLHRESLKTSTLALNKTGFAGFINVVGMWPGKYEVFLALTNGDKASWTPLNRTLAIPEP